MPVDEKSLHNETMDLIRPIVQHFLKSREHKTEVMSLMCVTIGTLAAALAQNNEKNLLDAFSLINKYVRQSGSDAFVEHQRFLARFKDRKPTTQEMLDELERLSQE